MYHKNGQLLVYRLLVGFMVFNATFNNILVS